MLIYLTPGLFCALSDNNLQGKMNVDRNSQKVIHFISQSFSNFFAYPRKTPFNAYANMMVTASSLVLKGGKLSRHLIKAQSREIL